MKKNILLFLMIFSVSLFYGQDFNNIKKSTEQGIAGAQNNLGLLYYNGEGTYNNTMCVELSPKLIINYLGTTPKLDVLNPEKISKKHINTDLEYLNSIETELVYEEDAATKYNLEYELDVGRINSLQTYLFPDQTPGLR